MKCEICNNYTNGECKFCNFEYHRWYHSDDWNILNLDDDYEWSHLQIQYRLKAKNIDCLSADIWWDNNLAYIIGAKAHKEAVADALGVNRECVYDNSEMGLMILNLFQEKFLRGLIK